MTSFISDDGGKIAEGDLVYVQDKEGGFYSAMNANKDLIERRLGICRKGTLDEFQPDMVPIYWNYFKEENNAIERKIKIETQGADKIQFIKKTII